MPPNYSSSFEGLNQGLTPDDVLIWENAINMSALLEPEVLSHPTCKEYASIATSFLSNEGGFRPVPIVGQDISDIILGYLKVDISPRCTNSVAAKVEDRK